jgi:hypothetical protein
MVILEKRTIIKKKIIRFILSVLVGLKEFISPVFHSPFCFPLVMDVHFLRDCKMAYLEIML